MCVCVCVHKQGGIDSIGTRTNDLLHEADTLTT